MEIDVTLAIVGGSLLALALLSTLLRRLLLSGVLIALLLGVAVGPEGLGLVEPGVWAGDERRLLEEVTRITLAISLLGVGLRLTRSDVRENLLRVASLLGIGMFGMWLLTGLGAWLVLGLPVWSALALGAILAPTDPVVASTLVNGRLAQANVPRRLRSTLLAESGANDGLALPLVLLAVLMATHSSGEALSDWAVESVREVGVAVAMGLALGWATGRLAELVVRRREIEATGLLGLGLALALLALGATHLAGGSGILACFVAGLAFSAVLEEHVREELDNVQETVTRVLILPLFLLLGTVLPWSAWREVGWAGLAFAAWALFLRRPPVVPVALARSQLDGRERAWLAWFGPMGAAALYYAILVGEYEIAGYDTVYAAATLTVCVSVIAHSLTATPGVRWVARRRLRTVVAHPLRADVEEQP